MFVNMSTGTASRAPRGALNRGRIIDAALGLIDADGLAALSARQLAARLGCKPMSLYNHIDSMDDLLDGVVDRLLASVLPETRPLVDIAAAARAYLALAERHPDAFILVGTRVWRGPGARAAAMAFISYFEAMGCGEREAWRRARILGAYLNGSGLALGAWKRSQRLAGQAGDGKAVRDDLEAGLAKLLALLSEPGS
jgi:AcrR family transcriptional regulator